MQTRADYESHTPDDHWDVAARSHETAIKVRIVCPLYGVFSSSNHINTHALNILPKATILSSDATKDIISQTGDVRFNCVTAVADSRVYTSSLTCKTTNYHTRCISIQTIMAMAPLSLLIGRYARSERRTGPPVVIA